MFEEVEVRKRRGLYRSMRELDGFGKTATVDGEDDRTLVLSSNSYLGLGNHRRLKGAACRAGEEYGTGAGASRLLSGNLEPHRRLEDEIADYKGTRDALVFSSGYAANVGTITAVTDERDVIFSDGLNHASIVDGCRLSDAKTVVYDHCDADDLRKKWKKHDGRRKLIVTDSVFSMDGDIAPLREISEIARDDGGFVMVDEAHATGVVGEEGSGVVGREGLVGDIDIQMGTMSKALGSQGGFVAGSSELIDLLVNEARSFVFSTGLSPIDAEVSREAVNLVRSDEGENLREDLWSNVKFLREDLSEIGYEILSRESQIVPVLVGDAEVAVRLGDKLEERSVFAPGVRPPTVPEGTSRIRVSAMATHTHDELRKVVDAFEEAGKEVGVI
ncbi:MAG: 8-amino-7-oxononanoate synthase [Halobacteria archaeon]|nr:8-amino-7-oxononanoate synthase [Halobacteria archaeon]